MKMKQPGKSLFRILLTHLHIILFLENLNRFYEEINTEENFEYLNFTYILI